MALNCSSFRCQGARMRTCTRFTALVALVLSIGQAWAAAPSDSKSERLAADAPKTTVLGNTFVAPAGWALSVRGRSTILEAPEGGSYLALFDVPVKEVASADEAVKRAWAEYKPNAKWPLKLTTPVADRDGWTDRKGYDYQTSP